MNTALVVIGFVVLVLGAAAYMYTVTETDSYFFGAVKDTNSSQPYHNLGLPLIVIGLVGILAGAVIPSTETKRETIITRQKSD